MFAFLQKIDFTNSKILRNLEDNLKDALILNKNENKLLENVNMKQIDLDSSIQVEQVNNRNNNNDIKNEETEKVNSIRPIIKQEQQIKKESTNSESNINDPNNDNHNEEIEEENHMILFCTSEFKDGYKQEETENMLLDKLGVEFEKQMKEYITCHWTDETYQHIIEMIDRTLKKNHNQQKEKKKLKEREKNTNSNTDVDSLEAYRECTNELFKLITKNILTLIKAVNIKKEHVDMVTYINEMKKKYIEEINILKKNERRLNDINERQTNQLVQLSFQIANCKNEEDKWNHNTVTHKFKIMELEIQRLKEEEQKLNELLQDKMNHMRSNFELKCKIKDLESILHKKSTVCGSLKKEVQQLKKQVETFYEHKQMFIEEIQINEHKIKEMEENQQKLKKEIEQLRNIRNQQNNNDINKQKEDGHKCRKKEEQKVRNEITEALCNGFSFLPNEMSVHTKKQKEESSNPKKEEEEEEEEEEDDDDEEENKKECNINNIIRDSKELKKKIKSYELLLQEYKSSSMKNKNNTEAQLKEVKKLLANEIKKNEVIQKNYQSLMNNIQNAQDEKIPLYLNNKNNKVNSCVKIDPSINNTKLNSLIDEMNLLTKEVKKLKHEQEILQEELQKKNQMISYLIKKYALSEEHLRLDSDYSIFKNKLHYEDMRKIMEETLIENIRLRTDIITLAKSVEEKKHLKK